MSASPEVEQKIGEYWKSDRSAVRKRYETLFGDVDAPQEQAPPAEQQETEEEAQTVRSREQERGADAETLFSEILADMGLSDALRTMVESEWGYLHEDIRPVGVHHLFCAGRPA